MKLINSLLLTLLLSLPVIGFSAEAINIDSVQVQLLF
jgi:hypothetical protein